MSYPSDLTDTQKLLIKASLSDKVPTLRKYDFFDVLNAILYVIKTGCQWNMIPETYPSSAMVYHHFRSWSERGWFSQLLMMLVEGKRCSLGRTPTPTVCILDSQSVRSALPHSEKGIDGHKRIKGIKRHVATDSLGYPLTIIASTANNHDSKYAIPLIANTLSNYRDIVLFKADQGYRGQLEEVLPIASDATLECVKSNFGTPQFIPMKGRWVVERTFSWMENYRRLTRNYEKLIRVATHIFVAACAMFMLKYF